MIELQESGYKAFTGSSARELGYGPEVTCTQVADYISPQGQRLGLSISQPLDGYEATVIMPQGHDYRNEPISIRRAEIMAHHLKSRVVLTEVPGTVGLIYPDATDPQGYRVYESHEPLYGAAQTPSQLRGALAGNFTEHARVQLDAVSQAVSLRSSDKLILFGESMGAVLSTDLVQCIGERGLTLSAVVLHEAVNASGDHGIRRLISLLSNLGGIENDRRDGYFVENEEIGHPIRAFEQTSPEHMQLDKARKKMSQQGLAALVNGIGMRKGLNNRLVDNLSRFGSHWPPVLLTRGYDSTVSHADEYDALTGQLQSDAPGRVRSWEYSDASVPTGHSFLMSLGRQTLYAQKLRHFIEAAAQ